MMNPIEFMKANGLAPEDYKAAPTVAVQDKRPVIARKRGTVKLVKQRRSRHQIGDVRKRVINEWFETGNPDMTGIFVPYLMLDVMQIVASEHLAKVDFRKEEVLFYNGMMNQYHRLNSLFFQDLTTEQKDAVIDMFDEFGEYIKNELEIFRLNIIGCVMELPDDFRAVCGSLCVAKLMASQAVRAYMGMYRKEFRAEDPSWNPLKSVEFNCSKLMEHYFARQNRLQQDCNLSTVDSVRRAEANVVKKILKFLKEYGQKEKGVATGVS